MHSYGKIAILFMLSVPNAHKTLYPLPTHTHGSGHTHHWGVRFKHNSSYLIAVNRSFIIRKIIKRKGKKIACSKSWKKKINQKQIFILQMLWIFYECWSTKFSAVLFNSLRHASDSKILVEKFKVCYKLQLLDILWIQCVSENGRFHFQMS